MAIFDILKSAGETLRKADKIEEYRQILDAQKELLEMQKKIQNLEEKNMELKKALETKENLIHENNAYWTSDEKKKEGPFCSRCWDVDKNLVRLHPCGNPAYYSCPNCKSGSVLIKPERDTNNNSYHNYNDKYFSI